MASYEDLVGQQTGDNRGLIREWANRDQNVLRQAIVNDALDWAADKAYRLLRIPPLEVTRTYTVNGTASEIPEDSDDTADVTTGGQRGGQVLTVRVPSDMTEIIYIRNASINTSNSILQVVYNEKVDSRTFLDGLSETKDYYFYTRIGDEYHMHGTFARGDIIEFHYYRRLPALNATYSVNLVNYNAGRLETAAGVAIAAPVPAATDAADIPAGARGQEARHWLRDENVRILLYGALWKVFTFLDEQDSMEKYQQMFHLEIDELNREETMRKSRGGNIAVSYNGRGLI